MERDETVLTASRALWYRQQAVTQQWPLGRGAPTEKRES
jgi:hypothetical protein